MMIDFKTKTKTHLTRLRRNKDGGFAIMAAVTAALLVAGLAVAIDVSNGYFAKQRLQDTTDAIALIAARDTGLTSADLTATANDYFAQQFPGARGDNIRLNSITRTGDTVQVDASNNIPTYFAQIFGRQDLDIRAESVATFAQTRLDIALVLDSTFSMQGTKMSSLKIAANNLIDTLEGFDNEDLNVSVVPFSSHVKVGLSRRNAVWLDAPADEVRQGNCYMRTDVTSRSNCREIDAICNRDGVDFSCKQWQCDETRSEPYNFCPPPRNVTWQGCVGSRLAPRHLQAVYGGVRIPGLLEVGCETELRPLTSDMTKVRETINAMSASGQKTYMPSGLLWGWRTLDPSEPLAAPAASANLQTQKVLILMTDGENNVSKIGTFHSGSSKSQADRTTRDMCSNIKDDTIQVFSISYEVSDNATRQVIQDCANSPNQYFRAENAQDLNEAFQAIGNSLSALRLTD